MLNTSRSPKKKRNRHEDAEQKAFVQWFRTQYPAHAQLCFHIPNGGLRSKREAATLKKLGVVAGIPDIFIARPQVERFNLPPNHPSAFGEKAHHGLFIEMKRSIIAGSARPRISPQQSEMINLLTKQDYQAVVCYGFDEARIVTLEYMRGI